QALCALRPGLKFALDPRLAEMDFGDWENRRWSELGRDAIDAWTADFAAHRCGGGESVTGLLARVASALDAACCRGDDVLWVTHAGVARAVRLLLASPPAPLTAAAWPREAPAFGAFECIVLDPDPVRARLRENAHAPGCS
ncbi:MAG: phosphoglycerate kinase, partial [Comamonadaceae bacterium]